eukprot:scaffold167376_cov82-Cyclotella_meneghiniana.AAC.5
MSEISFSLCKMTHHLTPPFIVPSDARCQLVTPEQQTKTHSASRGVKCMLKSSSKGIKRQNV